MVDQRLKARPAILRAATPSRDMLSVARGTGKSTETQLKQDAHRLAKRYGYAFANTGGSFAKHQCIAPQLNGCAEHAGLLCSPRRHANGCAKQVRAPTHTGANGRR